MDPVPIVLDLLVIMIPLWYCVIAEVLESFGKKK